MREPIDDDACVHPTSFIRSPCGPKGSGVWRKSPSGKQSPKERYLERRDPGQGDGGDNPKEVTYILNQQKEQNSILETHHGFRVSNGECICFE